MVISATANIALDPILAALDSEQRNAATLPDGPAQIIAPAGSGKTTTMVARIAVLLSRGVPADRICVVTFNRDAALDLAARLRRRLAPTMPSATDVEVRTLHALARQVLRDAGEGAVLVADRLPLIRAARRRIRASDADALISDPTTLDTFLSRWKIEGEVPPIPDRLVLDVYGDLLRIRGAVDFDDLVVRAAELLESDPHIRLRWQSRFSHVCVDEFQDVDAAQVRLVRSLAAPEDNLFVVGDDDQTIYAWRLADVRRILRFADEYPGAHRVMLATNYRCPATVIAASARMVATNQERFSKPIRAPAGLASDAGAIAVSDSSHPGWPDHMASLAEREGRAGRSFCFLSRTRTELAPLLLALVRAGVRHTSSVPLIVEAEPIGTVMAAVRSSADERSPFEVVRRIRSASGWSRGPTGNDQLSDEDHASLDALMTWSVAFRTAAAFVASFDEAHRRITALRDPDAPVELATVHGSKGREWETVVVVGFEAGRIPNARSIEEHLEPGRAVEEERRLAYVALTRATRRLILAFDPRHPSPFLAELGQGVAVRR